MQNNSQFILADCIQRQSSGLLIPERLLVYIFLFYDAKAFMCWCYLAPSNIFDPLCNRYSSTSSSAASVSDECSCSTNLLVVEVWSHHSAPPSTSLAEGKGTDWSQKRRTCVQMCPYVCASYTSPMNELRRPADSQARWRLRSASSSIYWSFVELASRPLVIGHFRSLRHVYVYVSFTARHHVTFPSSL